MLRGEILKRVCYLYAYDKGEYIFPNTSEGDLIKLMYEYVQSKPKEDIKDIENEMKMAITDKLGHERVSKYIHILDDIVKICSVIALSLKPAGLRELDEGEVTDYLYLQLEHLVPGRVFCKDLAKSICKQFGTREVRLPERKEDCPIHNYHLPIQGGSFEGGCNCLENKIHNQALTDVAELNRKE